MNEHEKKMAFSSNRTEWGTPQALFDVLNREFHFDIDLAATERNAKVPRFFSIKDDALSLSWKGIRGFLNPPYGRDVGKWAKKAHEETWNGGSLVVMLLAARTDTRWFHDYCAHGEVRFLRGRLKFEVPEYNKGIPAPFPSMVVIFGGEKRGLLRAWDWKKETGQ